MTRPSNKVTLRDIDNVLLGGAVQGIGEVVGGLLGAAGERATTYAVYGVSGAITGYGTEWQRVLTGTTEPLNAVWAVASNDVWAVGNGGTIVHWDGTAFSTVRSNTTSTLRALWGSGANNLWAVGDNGVALRYR